MGQRADDCYGDATDQDPLHVFTLEREQWSF
jgi:hypothetical protein